MALSLTGISLDWDCSSALEALLTEEVTADDSESISIELQDANNTAGSVGVDASPLYSPFSDVGSTQSVDSGFVGTPFMGEEDQLLAGLFGPDFPLLSEPSTTTTLSLSTSFSPPQSSPVSDHQTTTNSTILVPIKQNSQNNMFDPEFELDSPPPHFPSSSTDSKNMTASVMIPVEKSRKNAEAARQNRLKKKKYMEDLEKDRSRLKAENVIVKTRCSELQTKNRKLETEVAYLRSVLANQSTLATLIKNIPGIPGVNLTTSLTTMPRKRPCENPGKTSSTSPSAKRSRNDSLRHSGGVCLHVSKEKVSLEFCSQCSLKSSSTVVTEI